MKKRIFITGGTGKIGTCITEGLKEAGGYEVIRGTRGEGNGTDIVHVDILDPRSWMGVLKGAHTVIHLAFYLKSDKFVEEHIDGNLKSAYYLFEAAHANGVKRVINGSSNHVFGFYKKCDHVTSDSPYRPDSNYGLCKVFVETMSRYYSDRYGLSVFNIRIGNFSARGNERPSDERSTYIWLSNPDCQQLFRKCIEYDADCKFLNLFGISNNNGGYFDTSDNTTIGYEPQSDGAVYRGQYDRNNPYTNFCGVSNDLLISHDYIGGQNVALDQNGKIDINYLKSITDPMLWK